MDFSLSWLQIFESCPERIFYCYGFRYCVLSGGDFSLLWFQICESCPSRIFHCHGLRFWSPLRRGFFTVMASDFWVLSGGEFSLLWLQIVESPERIVHCYGFRFLESPENIFQSYGFRFWSPVRRGFFTVMASDFWVVSGEDLSLLWLQIFESCPETIFFLIGLKKLKP